jgi:hypothetical protein
LCNSNFEFSIIEIVITAINGFKFTAVNCDYRISEHSHIPAQHYEFAAHLFYRWTIVFSEICNGFKIRTKVGQFHIGYLLFITTAREGLTKKELEMYSDSGSLFMVETGIHGVSAFLFG